MFDSRCLFLLLDFIFYCALWVLPQRVEYSDCLLQGLHCVTLLAFDEAMQKQNIPIWAKTKNNADQNLTLYT